MSFRIQGLPRQAFESLLGQPDDALRAQHALRRTVDVSPGYPDRITLDEVPLGESAVLVNFEHQRADTPFRAAHAIYLWERAPTHWDRVDQVPPALARRVISLRAFDDSHMMIDAALGPGADLPDRIQELFANGRVAYLHAHYAKWGCFAARVDRA